MTNYTSESAPKHFAEALAAVIADKQCEPFQTDLLGIIPAWESYDKVRPLIFLKKAVMSMYNKDSTEGCCWQALHHAHAGLFVFCVVPLEVLWDKIQYLQKCTQVVLFIIIVINDCSDNAMHMHMQVLCSTHNITIRHRENCMSWHAIFSSQTRMPESVWMIPAIWNVRQYTTNLIIT